MKFNDLPKVTQMVISQAQIQTLFGNSKGVAPPTVPHCFSLLFIKISHFFLSHTGMHIDILSRI